MWERLLNRLGLMTRRQVVELLTRQDQYIDAMVTALEDHDRQLWVGLRAVAAASGGHNALARLQLDETFMDSRDDGAALQGRGWHQ